MSDTIPRVKNVKKKVMLYDCGNNIATVVDYMRKLRRLPYELIVPVYPEKDDMWSAVVRAGRSPFSSLREKHQETPRETPKLSLNITEVMGDKTKNLKRENDTLKTQLRELSEEVNTLREMVEKKIPQDSTDTIVSE